MASIIRLPGETDAEYSRRLRPLQEFIYGPLFRREIQKVLENRSVLLDHMRIADLRESCGVRPKRGDTFTWDVYS